MNLVTTLSELTWRRFLVLLFGLGPNSRYMIAISSQPDVIEDPEVAEKYVASMLG